MTTAQLISQLAYPLCRSHSEELSMVCLQKKCLDHLLICPICQYDKHPGHKVVSLKDYLLEAAAKEGNQSQILDSAQSIEQIRENVMTQLRELKERFNREMEGLEQQMVEYFTNIEQKFLKIGQLNSGKNVMKILNTVNGSQSPERYQQFIRKLRIYSSTAAKDALKHYVSSTQNKIVTFQNIFHSIKIQDNFNSIKSLFIRVKDPTFRPIYQWSTQKSHKIQTNGLVASQTASSSNGERFALMTAHETKNEDIEVGVKIRKLKGWIGVGICLRNVIVNGGYKFNYTQNYHGSYLISTNAYSWSHSQPAFNSAQKSFTYCQGDIIKITYQIEKNRVLFENLKKSSSFSLEVIDPPFGDYYVPCVNMCNPGDEVEIVNDLE